MELSLWRQQSRLGGGGSDAINGGSNDGGDSMGDNDGHGVGTNMEES